MTQTIYDHDGCKGCAYENKETFEEPCCYCKGIEISGSDDWQEASDHWKPVEPCDIVNHPPHYTQGDIECIDAMKAAFGADELAVYCKIAAFKYIWRCEHKNGLEDVKKAVWYLNKYIALKGGNADADTA